MSTGAEKECCGNCGHLVDDPDRRPKTGCYECDDANGDWVPADDDDLDDAVCNNWSPKEETNDGNLTEDTENMEENPTIPFSHDDGDEMPDTANQSDESSETDPSSGSGAGELDGEEIDTETAGAGQESETSAESGASENETESTDDRETATNSQSTVVDKNLEDLSHEELLVEARRLLWQTNKDNDYKKRLARLESQIESAKEEKASLSKEIKDCQDEMQSLVKQMNAEVYDPNKYPLIEKAASSSEETVTPVDPVADGVPDDSWKTFSAKEHFSFTEAEWELMSPSEGMADSMTVGDLEDFRVRVSREKVKGFGEAKRQKLDDQFDTFWRNHPEFCGLSTETTDHDAADDDETGEEIELQEDDADDDQGDVADTN